MKCAPSTMDEQIAPLEVPTSDDLDDEKREADFGGGSTASRLDVDVSMPICFLVKEQAKSLVAIQELQKRVENLEGIQDDVIDSLAEIRKYIWDTRTFSGLNLEGSSLNASNNSPSLFPKSESFSKPKASFNPVDLKKSKSPNENDASKLIACVQISEQPEKQFENKNKESALDSDKQDSGLDSDCREIHDNLSLKPSINWSKPESGDELLHLLDEISQRTEVLQKQLSVIDKNNPDNAQSEYPVLPSAKSSERVQTTSHQEGSDSASCLNYLPKHSPHAASASFEENMSRKISSDEAHEHFDGKSFTEQVQKFQKRTANKIDSAMVSSILKETNVVDLQRQVLIFLVENAVLHTKLGELEQLLSTKNAESNKLENSLKDETRLLMMENRELRISLDEQKLETNALRSKVSMLERVLQSISSENRELTWQLGESLGIQNLSQKDPRKFSSFTHSNSSGSKFTRRSSLPSKFASQNEFSCVRSKLLSNASSFLDVTAEEPEQYWTDVQTPARVCENSSGPGQASTPLTTYTKLRDVKSTVNSPLSSPNFQSVKKRFKSTDKESILKSQNFEKHPNEVPHDPNSAACAKNVKFNASSYEDSSSKFPFNTILEKLKANSDYRLSRRTSTHNKEANFPSDHAKLSAPFNTERQMTSEGEVNVASAENFRQNIQSKNFQARKGKNIHQRIQDILDRIMAESEETT